MTNIIPSINDPLLTVPQVAKMFSVTPYTVRTWIKTKKIKAIKLESGILRIQKSEMIRYANETFGAIK